MALRFKNHPGSGYIKAVCDVCRSYYYRKDLYLVTDPFNFQKGLMVCKKHLDKINEQVLPNRHYDKPVPLPELIRPDLDPIYVVNPNDSRVPSAPRNLILKPNPLADEIDLFWQGPEDNGSSDIIGYVVARGQPQGNTPQTFNINVSGTSYTDTTANVNLDYSYQIAATNGFGTGPYSNIAYWPHIEILWADINYLSLSQSPLTVLTTSDTGYYIRLNHQDVGIA